MKKTITLLKTIFIISFFFAQTGWSFASASSNEIKFLIQNEKTTHIEDAKKPQTKKTAPQLPSLRNLKTHCAPFYKY